VDSALRSRPIQHRKNQLVVNQKVERRDIDLAEKEGREASSVTLSGNTNMRAAVWLCTMDSISFANCHPMQSFSFQTNRYRIDAPDAKRVRSTFTRDLVYLNANAFVLQLSVPFSLSSIMPARKITNEYPLRVRICVWVCTVAFKPDKYLHGIAADREIEEKSWLYDAECCIACLFFYSFNSITWYKRVWHANMVIQISHSIVSAIDARESFVKIASSFRNG